MALFVLLVPALAVVSAGAAWRAGLRPATADWVVFGACTSATMVGAEVGYHRYFTHRSFKARPALEWLLGVLGSATFLGPVIWWAATHRRHHLHTDVEGDPHSPHWPYRGGRGLWHAHAGWVLDPEHTRMALPAQQLNDLTRNPRIVAINRRYLLLASTMIALPAVAGLIGGGTRGLLVGLLWGGLVRIFIVSHLVWAINSLGHSMGARARESTSGDARNNLWLVLVTAGGGWHANHHDRPAHYTTSSAWWQIDPGAFVIRGLKRLGLASEPRGPRSREKRDGID
jgi:stearoyl-CoA desaturase (delta-9 desaturase)